jgi:hypothetical protein
VLFGALAVLRLCAGSEPAAHEQPPGGRRAAPGGQLTGPQSPHWQKSA